MSQKRIKSAKKHTVKEVLKSLEWSVEDGKLILLSRITDEYVTLDSSVFKEGDNGGTINNGKT